MGSAPDRGPFDAALDELYGVEPRSFVATRKRLAAALRSGGEAAAAQDLLARRRPTKVAWALNQLARREPELLTELLARAGDVAAAQTRAVQGDRDALRDATRALRAALGAAADAAVAALPTEAPDDRTRVVATLHAAAAEDDVADQLRRGVLVREAEGVTGFPLTDGDVVALAPRRAARTERPTRPARREPPPEPGDAGRRREEAGARVRAELDTLREELEDARREVEGAESEVANARAAADGAQAALAAARADVRSGEQRTRRARRHVRELEARERRLVTGLEDASNRDGAGADGLSRSSGASGSRRRPPPRTS
jgi:hypothetical protein